MAASGIEFFLRVLLRAASGEAMWTGRCSRSVRYKSATPEFHLESSGSIAETWLIFPHTPERWLSAWWHCCA
jgi:hypothetical protein